MTFLLKKHLRSKDITNSIFNLFDDFIDSKMDVNHAVLQKLFDIGFNVKTDYTERRSTSPSRRIENCY